MKSVFEIGEKKKYTFVVKQEDVASFEGKMVHAVCATFTLAREIEWATRQYVLEMKESDEEGIGTALEINHKAPAFVGEAVNIFSELIDIKGNEIICSYEAVAGERTVARGITGQKILKKEKIQQIFSSLKQQDDKG